MRISHSGRIGNHHPPARITRPHPVGASGGRPPLPKMRIPAESATPLSSSVPPRPPCKTANSGRIGNSPLLPTILSVAPFVALPALRDLRGKISNSGRIGNSPLFLVPHMWAAPPAAPATTGIVGAQPAAPAAYNLKFRQNRQPPVA